MRRERFKLIESLFFPYLKKEADKIRIDFKDITCNAYVHYPPDNEPGYGYFSITLECLLDNADFDKTDAISLGIDIDDHNNNFLMTADVAWGYPKAETVEKMFEQPVQINEENLNIVQKNLPNLVIKLRELIRENPNGVY